MGRAIVRNPQAFLMDEPLSNLDAKLRVEMRAEIARIQRDLGVTTIYVTHDQTEAMTMGDRVAVMRNGLLQQIAAPKVLYDRPRNLFVAEFIGSPAMNLVDGARSSGSTATSGSRSARTACASTRRRSSATTASPAYDGREVVLGIRPEDMEDAAVAARDAPGPRHLRGLRHPRGHGLRGVRALQRAGGRRCSTREVVEALVVEDAEDEETRLAAERARGGGVVFIARLDRTTEARERQPVDVAVDVTRLHFFDPETGVGIHGSPADAT